MHIYTSVDASTTSIAACDVAANVINIHAERVWYIEFLNSRIEPPEVSICILVRVCNQGFLWI